MSMIPLGSIFGTLLRYMLATSRELW